MKERRRMALLCGTDFSEASAQAARAAACLAARGHEPLHLVHALDVPAAEVHAEPQSTLLAWAEKRLLQDAEQLRALGAEVSVHVTGGSIGEALSEKARELSVRMIVVGALGRGHRSEVGSHADRTAQQSAVPVLVVRDATPFQAWLKNERPLRVVLGVDASRAAEHASRWVSEFCKAGACELVLAHFYWPPGEFHRLGLGGVRSYVNPDAEIQKTIERENSERFAPLVASVPHRHRIEPHMGRVGDALLSLAHEEHADLLVVGCHERSALSLLWEGSVARRVLRGSRSAVACVPAPAQTAAGETPALQEVLAAADFSAPSNAAVALAYASVKPGGVVHLVHVIPTANETTEPFDIFGPAPAPGLSDAEAQARSRLTDLVPSDAAAKGTHTRVHVLFAQSAAPAICQAAERLGVDMICIGTRGRTGIAKAVLGSVATSVLSNTGRPVLLAHGTRR